MYKENKNIALIPFDILYEKNKIFEVENNPLNRDNILFPFFNMRQLFLEKNIDIQTYDILEHRASYVLYFRNDLKLLKKNIKKINIYCAWEPEVVDKKHSIEGLKKISKYYDYIMTWNDDIVDNKIFFKIDFPYHFSSREILYKSFKEKKLLTNISGNKASTGKFELYSERIKVIEYFENYSDDFDFYGTGWQMEKYKNYKGMCDSKFEIYSKYKFALCLENMYNINGYITEKILDCFNVEIVPIYKGAKNINEYIPKDCYIEYDKFDSIEELHQYLKNMTEEEYLNYIKNIRNYKKNEMKFSAEKMVENILEIIKLDKKRIETSVVKINLISFKNNFNIFLKRVKKFIVKKMRQS